MSETDPVSGTAEEGARDEYDAVEARPEELPEDLPEELGHPRGTLVIVALYGLLFALGWLGLYLFRFLERGAPHS